jgi:predicted porin
MNKKLLAVALATAFAAPAMAEGVQIYGAFDVGVLVRGGNEGATTDARDTRTNVSSGMNGHNFIGFKMSEDLGNGMTLSGDAQFGFNLDSGDVNTTAGGSAGSNLRTITSTLALSGDFGTVVAGRTGGARAAWIKKYDPFGGFGVAGALGTHGGGGEDYANNVVAWVTPELGIPGLKGLAAYTTSLDSQDNNGTKNTLGALYAFALMYDNGPLSFVLNTERLWTSGLKAAGVESIQVYTVGASYDLGAVKVYGLYDMLTNVTTGWQVGAAAPVSSALTLKAGYIKSKGHGLNGNGTDCDKAGAGLTYALSKRTNFYADVATLTSSDRATCAINTYGGQHGAMVGSDAQGVSNGYGATGFDAGIRHTF